MLQKIIGLKDVVIMTFAASFGIRWLAVAAGIGPSSIIFWFLGALFFFVPLALVVAEFSSKYAEEGGMYSWTRHQLGNGPAFIVAWFYWVNNLFYYPAILTFFATSFTYAFNRPDLADNEKFITLTVIISFWVITFIVLQGLKPTKWITNLGGIFGSFLIVFFLVVLSFVALFWFHHSATVFNLKAFIPGSGVMNNLSSLSILMFAMAGIEIIPTLANQIRNPNKTLPKGLMIAALVIFCCYALGTVAMNIMASPDKLQKTTGLMSAFGLIALKLHIGWLNQLMAFFLVLGEIAALAIWIIVPVVMFFKATQKGILPEWLHRANKKGVPANALVFQAITITLIVLFTWLLPSVNLMYQALILMAEITFFIPYFLMIFAFVKFKWQGGQGAYQVPGGKWGASVLAFFIFCSLSLAVVLSFVPPSNLTSSKEIILYELEIGGGPLILILLAWILYWRAKQRHFKL